MATTVEKSPFYRGTAPVVDLDFNQFNARWLASLPEEERVQFTESLTPQEAEALQYAWKFWARKNQVVPKWNPRTPDGKWHTWLILAGRGYGKTRTGAETIRYWVEECGVGRLGLIGQTAADVRDVMIEGESGILAISPPWFMPKYEPSKRRLTWPNGAIAQTYSGDEPDQLRGPQHEKVWADEPAKWKYLQDTWDNMELGNRLGLEPQVAATTTPRNLQWLKDLIADPTTIVTRGSTIENAGNLPASFFARILKKYQGTRVGRQELEAEILEDLAGALWSTKTIDPYRVTRKNLPPLKRVVVAVDPKTGEAEDEDDEDASETGIMVGGLGEDDEAYVLSDDSDTGSPNEWGGSVIRAYNTWEADRIVAEKNQGGAMVEFVIKSQPEAKNVNYRAVSASRGKITRAEPVAALYEQGRVHHVGNFTKLERQMCSYIAGKKSPDRLDALVWLITDLMLGGGKREADVF